MTPHQHSEVGARRQHGRHGRLMRRSLKHLPFWLHTPLSTCILTLKIERLTVVLYDKTSSLSSANEAREELFCRKNRSIDNIPPTQNALLQHTQRAVYQAGIWTTSTQVHQVVSSPSEFGWSKSPTAESWVPVWITIPEVLKACNQLIRCACKGDCSRCKCAKANLSCSPLCSCKCFMNKLPH